MWVEGYWWIHSTPSTLSVTWFCGGWSLWGSNQGCRLFLGYIQSNWKDEKWQSHKSPQSRAADAEHITTCVPGECAPRQLPPDRASAVASCEAARLTVKLIVVLHWIYEDEEVKPPPSSSSVCLVFPSSRREWCLGLQHWKCEERCELINTAKLNHCQGFDSTL